VDEEPSAAIRQVEEIWLDGQQKYLQLSQLGRNFMADALKVFYLKFIPAIFQLHQSGQTFFPPRFPTDTWT
jgi:hypothetical protein